MSRKTQKAGAIALAAMMVFTITSADATGAAAQDPILGAPDEAVDAAPALIRFISREVVQPLPQAAQSDAEHASAHAASLTQLVAAMPDDAELSKDMQCLAGAIYFESRGEPLIGQLAVADVIINRAASGRFPASYCGVVYQRSQFSFVRGGQMPRISTGSLAWNHAKAIARIAHEGLWDSPTKDALFFHAAYVQPNWRLERIGRVSSHVFYR